MNETNAHGTNRMFLIMTNWNIMCIEKMKETNVYKSHAKPIYIWTVLTKAASNLIVFYFNSTKLC